ncbi:GTPase-associated system all-helical protein GASH [Sorangium sp. So ce1097]|uniref:GTPase-associated system all-helical protein GASH n=1 Tax=Sorangium sp. So ce1097 TaxID=3133330 RepID=UPI003F6273DC
MAASAEDIRDRLIEIWRSWSLAPEVAFSEAQRRALDAVSAWLERAKREPEIAIRAVQILLADPERPDVKKHACWGALRRELKEAWANVGTGRDDLFYGQALLLAAWPGGTQQGWLSVAEPMDSAWEVTRGRQRQREDLVSWRVTTRSPGATDEQATGSEAEARALGADFTPFEGVTLSTESALQQVRKSAGQQYYNTVGPHVSLVLNEHHAALATLSDAVSRTSKECAWYSERLAAYIGQVVQDEMRRMREERTKSRAELDLLWWGQARYCRACQKSYRRMSDPADVLWWAAREAAELSRSLDVEPAAAYLVETLRALNQDIFERKPLLRWMEELHAALTKAPSSAPPLSQRLQQIANDDALGLPVTWVRLQAAAKEPLAGASDAIALNLDAEIDRGAWASWLFRETLLDLRLAQDV